VRNYKPFNDIYEYVAQKEAISSADIAMVATHDWDLFGK
jgi:2-haloacid dehalogenase